MDMRSDESAGMMVTAETRPCIFLVEDDAALLDALSFALETEGYATRSFPDQESVLAAPDLDQAACFIIDFLLTPLDGLDLLAELRRRGAVAPAILITTEPDDRCRRRAKRMGTPIVEKPLMTDALSRKIRSLL